MPDEFDLASELKIPKPKGGSKPSRLNVPHVEDYINARTAPGRELLEYRKDLIEDCGGADAVTSAQERLVEQAVITRALLEIASVWAVEHLRAGFGTDDKVLPWLIALDRLQEREARLLKRLGLDRSTRVKRPRSMKELLQQQAEANRQPGKQGGTPT